MKFPLVAALLASPALAQDPAATVATPTPPAATAPAAVTPICTDRPTKSNFACTVPAGDVQIETDVANWTRNTVAGVRTDTVLPINPTIKLGLGSHTDVEVNWAPYVIARTHAPGASTDRLEGVGDVYLRLKQRLTADDAKTQVSIIPYVKAPTARLGIGNDRWEGGAIVAANIPLPAGWTLTTDPELDLLADGDGHGRHASVSGLVNLSHAVGKAFTVYGELWTQQNFDPAKTVRQYSADVAVTWLVTPTWQLDFGGNFGLNRNTPDTQVYLGLSTRF